ncbi:hypothetical protein CPC08DRAFT_762925 [Agrocybe pediades]|nr:hypothetical protein CPC08DRAFT_762925 [Agrocybe pediades]
MAQAAHKRLNIQDLHEDILHLIFEEISDRMVADDDDRMTLAGCLLVSKTFRHFALVRLFFQIIISNRRLGADNVAGVSLLKEILSPPDNIDLERLAPHVQILSIGFVILEDAEEKLRMCTDLLNHPDLVHVLGTLHQGIPGVSQFRFDFMQITGTPVRFKWSDLNPASQAAFHSFINSPFLKDLIITCIDKLSRDLVVSSNVKRLTLFQYSPQYTLSRQGASERDLITIDSPPGLELLVSDASYRYNTVKGLKILEMRFPPADVSADSLDLIKECADTLTKLIIDHTAIKEPFQKLFPSFRLDNMPKLEYFSLYESCRSPSSSEEVISPTPFHRILDVSKPMAFLRKLHLTYWYVFFDDPYRVEKDPVWEQLDKLLTGRMYPSLETVSITVHRRPYIDWESVDERGSKAFTNHIRKLLPRLSSSGKAFDLKITTGTWQNPAYAFAVLGAFAAAHPQN